MLTPRKRRVTVKRVLSSQSLRSRTQQIGRDEIELVPEKADVVADDAFAVGDAEFHIEYHNVPVRLLLYNSIHRLIQFNFFPLQAVICGLIFLIVLVFACLYLLVSDDCGLDLHTFNDAYLFSILVHFKSVLNPPNDDGMFWRGCPVGATVLFAQLFIGNILMSILLSSLVFSFQSLSRRDRALFNKITLGHTLYVSADPVGAVLTLPVVELNESLSQKITDVSAQVYVFDPLVGRISTIGENIQLPGISVPADLAVKLPLDVIDGTSSKPAPDTVHCEICGKRYADIGKLKSHLSYMQDEEHVEFLDDVIAGEANVAEVSSEELLGRIRKRELEIIVIVEGADPITSDRVQVQKIYRRFEIVDAVKRNVCSVSKGEDGEADIDYRCFL